MPTVQEKCFDTLIHLILKRYELLLASSYLLSMYILIQQISWMYLTITHKNMMKATFACSFASPVRLQLHEN